MILMMNTIQADDKERAPLMWTRSKPKIRESAADVNTIQAEDEESRWCEHNPSRRWRERAADVNAIQAQAEWCPSQWIQHK